MKEFSSLAALAEHLTSNVVGELKQVKHGLSLSAELIEKTAREEIGTYQGEIAMFPAWAELSPATEADKARQGYSQNSPLLRTGEMRDSIQHEVGEWEATIGSTDPTMIFHELGTDKMPARPVFGPALYRNLSKIQKLIGNAAVAGFVGGTALAPEKGYTIEGSTEI